MSFGRRLKTEHAGPKKGQGAYYVRKKFAKNESSHLRRQNGRSEAADAKNNLGND